jgi:exodeoxyribonuclease V alpha subunit
MPAPQQETLTGTLDRIVYINEENHYTVASLTPERAEGARGKIEPVTVVGNLAAVQCGETLKLTGHWTTHKQFGRQFRVESFESVLPSTTTGLKKYLGSGLIKGIGPKFAERIVAHFGADTLRIIDQFSARLREVEGIGAERARRIRAAWVAQKAVREIMIFLQSYGISTSQAAKIYKTYGDNAIELVKQNPYRLARDIYGIGFRTADKIASALGVPHTAPFRLQAGLRFALESAADDGHVCLPRPLLLRNAAELLALSEERQSVKASEGESVSTTVESARSSASTLSRSHDSLELALAALAAAGEIVIEPVSVWEARPRDDMQPELFVFLTWLHRAETGVAQRLKAIANAPLALPPIVLHKAIEWAQNQTKLALAPAQRQAVEAALTSKITVITGGPGVGKTTVVNSIVRILRAKDCKVLLCAPTGRAAKRLSETTGVAAQTIHRLLKYDAGSRGFVHDEATPLKCDALVVDETSMLDIPLAHALLRAVPNNASVIFVGDADQLPSVGAGSFLHDLLQSRVASIVRLTEIFRQAAGSLIITNAHRVNRGEMPIEENPKSEIRNPKEIGNQRQRSEAELADDSALNAEHRTPKPLSDFYFVEKEGPHDCAQTIVKLVTERIPKRFGFDPVKDVQVLTPMHKGECGAANLNRLLQSALRPQGPANYSAQDLRSRWSRELPVVIERYGRLYRVGDKVMQLRNNYDKDVFNGDMGIVTEIDLTEQTLTARIDERDVQYDFTDLDELAPAYAVTVHKSQGSEYPCVVVPLLTQHYMLLQRNLLYTAITRGKKLVVLVGSKKALGIAVRNAQTTWRFSRLVERLRSS